MGVKMGKEEVGALEFISFSKEANVCISRLAVGAERVK